MIWAGINTGKTHHHCVVVNDTGKRPLSRRVADDELELLRLLADGGAALLIDLLIDHGRHSLHIPGTAVNRASQGYRGEGKTDAKDAAITADQARIRRDMQPLWPGDELVTELKILTVHRRDLTDDRTRAINRLRGHLTGIFPALERALDLTNAGPLILLTGRHPPDRCPPAGDLAAPVVATPRSWRC